MHVVYLNPSGQLGGAETSLAELLSGLRAYRRDWRLSVVLGEDGPVAARLRALGVRVEVEPMPRGIAGAGEGGGWSVRLPAAAVLYTARLKRAIRALRPDLIHTNGLKMHVLGAWAAPAAVPVVWHIHDYVQARPLMSRILKRAAGRVSGVIVNSESVNADVRTLLGGSAEIRTIYNAVNLSRFSPDGDVADLDALAGLPAAPAGTIRIGLIGTFARWKGHTTFLRAISLLPGSAPVQAYVIGGPIYQTAGSQYSMEELQALTAELGLTDRVGFTGFVADPAPLMRALDIVVHASTRPEPFGMVIAEAMACRRAVVASQAGGATEIFEHGVTALGHRPGDAADLAAAIGQLVESPAARTSLAEYGWSAVQSRFSTDRLAREMGSFYARLAPSCACPTASV